MSKKKRKLVVANWKMNPASLDEAKELFSKTRRVAKKLRQTDVAIAPSFIYIPMLSKLLPSKNVFLSAQNVHQKDSGSFTGEVSAPMLEECKVRYVILGHSERRYPSAGGGENNVAIKEKIQAVLRMGMVPIICVGEKERDEEGKYLNIVREQIMEIFGGLPKKQLLDCVITYEPSWAIGHSYSGSLTGTDMHEMSLFIRKVMSEIFGKDYGWGVRILYGGSAEEENVRDIMEKGEISGLLVGHASLDPSQFSKILRIVDERK